MDTENIDDPFMQAKVGDKVIVGGRSMKVFSDNKDVAPTLNESSDSAATGLGTKRS
jgi:hypothetical protein